MSGAGEDASYDEMLRAMPLGYRLPCAGCAHLEPRGEDFICAFPIPVAVARWMQLRAYGVNPESLSDTTDISRWITRKQVYGPFAEDANEYECSARSPTPSPNT